MYIVEGTLPDQLLGSVAKHPLDRGALVAYGAVGLQDGDDVRTVLDEGPESFFVLPQRLFGAPAFGYIGEDALPVQGMALSVPHQHRLVANPDHAAIARDLAELHRERLPRPVRAPVLRQDPLAVLGVGGAYPEVGVVYVFVGGVAHNLLDLGAYVGDGAFVLDLLDVSDRGDLLYQRAVASLRLLQPLLGLLALGDVYENALPVERLTRLVSYHHGLVAHP